MYMIAERENCNKTEKRRLGNAFAYVINYGIVAICYLLMTKLFQYLTGVAAGQAARAEIISSLDAVIRKAGWFVTIVIPQSLYRISAVLFGNTLFNENNMFYSCTYKNAALGIVMLLIWYVWDGAGILFAWGKQKCNFIARCEERVPDRIRLRC